MAKRSPFVNVKRLRTRCGIAQRELQLGARAIVNNVSSGNRPRVTQEDSDPDRLV